MATILVFETATPTGGAALFHRGQFAGEMSLSNPQAHSRLCMSLAEALLKNCGVQWKDLTAVATSHGPGSFTGLRVGLTLAKSLCWSLGIPAVSVSTLEALARHSAVPGAPEFLVPLLDARIGEVYGAVFRWEAGGIQRVSEDFVCAPEAVMAHLPGPALFSGEGALKHFTILYANHGQLAPPDRVKLTPAAIGALALEKFAAGEVCSAADLAAVYLRDAVQPRA